MTPGARLQASIELSERIWTAPIPMDKVCADYFRNRRHIGSKDRAAIAERVYSLMRHHARLEWWCTRLNVQGVRVRVLLHQMLVEHVPFEKLAALCLGGRYDPPPLTETEAVALPQADGQALHHPDMPDTVRVECPPQHEAWLRAAFGDDFLPRMEATLKQSTLDLRVNTLKISRADAKASLAKDGVRTDDTDDSPWGLRVQGKTYMASTKAFLKGWVEIQDEGSQIIAQVCDVKPGQQVLDYCAGGGGKTLALAAMMENKGRIVAMDMDQGRLDKGRVRYKKAGVHNFELRALSDEAQVKWLKRQKENFDCVLVDAPCSSSGTWQRNPDLRWRQYGPKLDELLRVQAEILDKVVPYVKPGGALVYATCSVNPAENDDQIVRFLDAHPMFTLEKSRQWNGFFMARMIKTIDGAATI